MKEQLEYFIKINLKNPKEEEIEAILEIFHLKHFDKDEHFKFPDTDFKKLGFIVEGSMRHYIVKNNGNEITGRISQKNDFVTDIISVKTKGKTSISIKALESTSMLVTSIEKLDKLYEENLTLNRLMRQYMAENIAELGKRYMLFLAGSAKERYQFILDNNPHILKNIPLRFIASMIGITPTQLSRIRNKK